MSDREDMMSAMGWEPSSVCRECAKSQQRIADLEEQQLLDDQVEEVLRATAEALTEVREIMRREGFVIGDLDDRWQKLAFTLYTKIASLSAAAEDALAQGSRKAVRG